MSEPTKNGPLSATTLYVLVPPSPLFAAHWSLFLPHLLPYDSVSRRYEESDYGRRIHVSGDRLNGFSLVIIRNYNIKKHKSVGGRRFAIGAVSARFLQHNRLTSKDSEGCQSKDDDEGGGWIDNTPIDQFEEQIISIQAPGRSLNPTSALNQPRKKLKEVRDCQWWVKQVIRELCDKEMLQSVAEEDPIAAVAKLPVH